MNGQIFTSIWTQRLIVALSPTLLFFFGACGGGGGDDGSAAIAQLQAQMQSQGSDASNRYNELVASFNALKNQPDCAQAVGNITQQLMGNSLQNIQNQASGNAQPSSSSNILGLVGSIAQGSGGGAANCSSAIQNALAEWQHFDDGLGQAHFQNSTLGCQFLQGYAGQIASSLSTQAGGAPPPAIMSALTTAMMGQMSQAQSQGSSCPLFNVLSSMMSSYSPTTTVGANTSLASLAGGGAAGGIAGGFQPGAVSGFTPTGNGLITRGQSDPNAQGSQSTQSSPTSELTVNAVTSNSTQGNSGPSPFGNMQLSSDPSYWDYPLLH